MKKTIVLILVAVAILVSSCTLFTGSPGNIYGEYYYDGSSLPYLSLGGFPPGLIYPYNYYTISPGTYAVYYQIYSSVYGYVPSLSSYYYATYSVSANPGSFLSNGSDKHFGLYLSYNGLDNFGNGASVYLSQTPGAKVTPKLGTFSWTQNGLTVTVTNSIVQLTADQLAKLQVNTVGKK
jgi:hypothetical protein